MSESTGHSYLKAHEISGDVLALDVSNESTAVLESARAAGQGHAAITLVKEGPLRLILLGLKAGATLHEHQAGGPVSLQALSGQIDVSSGQRAELLQPGKVLIFESSVAHSLSARSDSVVLVTIAWPQTA